jgi:hypothetical protein
VAVLSGDRSRKILRWTVRSGETVDLSSVGSSDPDGNRLSTSWFVYPEAGTCRESVALSASAGQSTSLVAPSVTQSQTVHVILQLEDDGNPTLTSYRRAVIEVRP